MKGTLQGAALLLVLISCGSATIATGIVLLGSAGLCYLLSRLF